MKLFLVIVIPALLAMSLAAYGSQEVPQKGYDFVELDKARLAVNKVSNKNTEMAYLNLFPKSFKRFVEVFGYSENENASLYMTHEDHLRMFLSLRHKHSDYVMEIMLGISSDASWEADAVGMLQRGLATFAAEKTCFFAEKLQALSDKKRDGVIKFIADVENFHAYKEFSVIVNNLEECGCPKLVSKFQAARSARQNEKNH